MVNFPLIGWYIERDEMGIPLVWIVRRIAEGELRARGYVMCHRSDILCDALPCLFEGSLDQLGC